MSVLVHKHSEGPGAVPVMKSSVLKRSKKLSNWLSRRRARARMSSFLSGFPVNAISSSTTAANLAGGADGWVKKADEGHL